MVSEQLVRAIYQVYLHLSLHYHFRLTPGLPHLLDRRVKDAGHDDIALPGFGAHLDDPFLPCRTKTMCQRLSAERIVEPSLTVQPCVTVSTYGESEVLFL